MTMTPTTTTLVSTSTQPDLLRALSAESVKLRRSPILVTAVVLPFIMAFVVNLASSMSPTFRPPNVNVWDYSMQSMISFWSVILVFVVPLLTAMLAALEHTNHMWKHLFALSISRQSVYLAKVITGIVLFGLSMIVVFVATILSGLLLRLLKPELGFDAQIPFGSMLVMTIVSFLAQWLIIALHTWVGTRYSNFGPAIGLGLVAFLINIVILPRSDIWQKIYPWALPSNFFKGGLEILSGQVLDWNKAKMSIGLSLIGCVIVTVIATWDITRRDVA
jgi:hypothetical protein